MAADWKIRAPLGTPAYWNRWLLFRETTIADAWVRISRPPGDPSYRPQYLMEQSQMHREQMISLYSAGAPIRDLSVWFDGLLRAWEASRELEPTVYAPDVLYSRRTWCVNLDLYINCFWMVGLALTLEVPDEQWRRLVALVGNEGQDSLMDRVISTRQPGRRIGDKVLFPRPYSRLLAALEVEPAARPQALHDFLQHWYPELDRKATKGRAAIYNQPYWYNFGNENFEGGAYFGRWCVEAAAVAKAFSIDDSLCCGHEHYPGDLLRRDGPSTHPERTLATARTSRGWWTRFFKAT